MNDRDKITAVEFFKEAAKPDRPNQMRFQVDRSNDERPDRTFSLDAIDGMTANIHDFIMARIFGEWLRTGIGPKHIGVNINIDFNAAPLIHERLDPWWQLNDEEHAEAVKDFWKIVTEGEVDAE